MAKSRLRLEARSLRKQGKSICSIAQLLSVSKGSASRWCSDIRLNEQQIASLLKKKEEGLRKGQLVAAELKRNERLQKVTRYKEEGIKRFELLESDKFFVAGLALYLGEGSKKERKVAFVNSDPEVILFMLVWLQSFFGIAMERIAPRIHINGVHKRRLDDVERFWSKLLGMPKSQFRKTMLIKAKQLKSYENYENHYGTLTVRVLKSTELFYKIQGLIHGLLRSVTGRRSSVVRAKPS